MKPWELFTPQVVFMVTTKQEKSWRCKPFSWVVPFNKGPLFGIMMKRGSQTLINLLKDPRFSIAVVPASSVHAQDVLMTTAQEPETREWEVAVPRGLAVPAAIHALAVAECTFLGYSDLLIGLEKDEKKRTHLAVLGRIDRIIECAEGEEIPVLLHYTGKVFAAPKSFEVVGY